MPVKIQEQHREGDRVNVKDLLTGYDRYVPAKDWDSDPEMCGAEIGEFLARMNTQPPPKMPPVNKDPVEMDDAAIEAKLAEKAEEGEDNE